MSTGFECEFIGTKGQWFYTLQDWDCPVGAWDWREHATTYGPFASEEAAQQHLRDNHANPGGYSTQDYGDGEIDESTKRCIAEAKAPQPRNRHYYYKGF